MPGTRPGMTVMGSCVHDSFIASIFPHYPSWPGLSRPSTFLSAASKDVDARHKAGHDGDPRARTWMPGTRPGMTVMGWCFHDSFFASIFPRYPSWPGLSRPSTSSVVRHASGALHYLTCHFIYGPPDRALHVVLGLSSRETWFHAERVGASDIAVVGRLGTYAYARTVWISHRSFDPAGRRVRGLAVVSRSGPAPGKTRRTQERARKNRLQHHRDRPVGPNRLPTEPDLGNRRQLGSVGSLGQAGSGTKSCRSQGRQNRQERQGRWRACRRLQTYRAHFQWGPGFLDAVPGTDRASPRLCFLGDKSAGLRRGSSA